MAVELLKIKSSGWHINSIKLLIELAKTNHDAILNVMDIIMFYDLREYDAIRKDNKDINIITILTEKPSNTWETEIYKLAISQHFPGESYVKLVNELEKEILDSNLEQDFSQYLKKGELQKDFRNITDAYEKKSILATPLKNEDPISNWNEDAIQHWAAEIKNQRKLSEDEKGYSSEVINYERIAVVKRAVEVRQKEKEETPRTVQLLSLLFLLESKTKGRLMQINTGEGKSLIIAMFAAIKALEGYTVDVITSSPELAKPHAENQESFFACFGLTVKHNEYGNDLKSKLMQNVYCADVVYGSSHEFMADYLRDKWFGMKICGKRKFGIAIVDEVDNLLIDCTLHIVKLSSTIPGMKHLKPLLVQIWIAFHYLRKIIFSENGTFYIVVKNQKTKIPNVEKFLKENVEIYMRKMLRDHKNLKDKFSDQAPINDTYPKLEIPKHLQSLVKNVQLTKWINNVYHSWYSCEKDRDYVLRDHKVVIVDAANTGILQKDMVWANGQHQFLQMKHDLKLSAENLSTCYISNVYFFKKYGGNLYGLSGTLGSVPARRFINKTYNVDNIIIPPFQKKQFSELKSIITHTEDDWYQNIMKSSFLHLGNGRAVSIIVKYIEHANKIIKLCNKHNFKEVYPYITDEDYNTIKEKLSNLDAGELIVATCIAGRGTDIGITNAVNDSGGLHVCITFFPDNERVESQLKGRTSRTGNKGTAQFVLFQERGSNIQDLICSRIEQEEKKHERDDVELKKMLAKDKIFENFCNYKVICDIKERKQQINEKLQQKNLTEEEIKTHKITQCILGNQIQAISERFGIWLETNDYKSPENMQKDFDAFLKQLENEQKKLENEFKYTKNPYYFILHGNALLKINSEKITCELLDKAINHYTKAIEYDENFVADAYYYRAYACLKKAISAKTDSEFENRLKEKAASDLQTAKSIIEDKLIPMSNITLKYVKMKKKSEQKNPINPKDLLEKQTMHELIHFKLQNDTVDFIVGCDVDKLLDELVNQEKFLIGKNAAHNDNDIKELKKNREKLEKTRDALEKGSLHIKSEQKLKIEVQLLCPKFMFESQNVPFDEDEMKDYENNGFMGYVIVPREAICGVWNLIGRGIKSVGPFILPGFIFVMGGLTFVAAGSAFCIGIALASKYFPGAWSGVKGIWNHVVNKKYLTTKSSELTNENTNSWIQRSSLFENEDKNFQHALKNIVSNAIKVLNDKEKLLDSSNSPQGNYSLESEQIVFEDIDVLNENCDDNKKSNRFSIVVNCVVFYIMMLLNFVTNKFYSIRNMDVYNLHSIIYQTLPLKSACEKYAFETKIKIKYLLTRSWVSQHSVTHVEENDVGIKTYQNNGSYVIFREHICNLWNLLWRCMKRLCKLMLSNCFCICGTVIFVLTAFDLGIDLFSEALLEIKETWNHLTEKKL